MAACLLTQGDPIDDGCFEPEALNTYMDECPLRLLGMGTHRQVVPPITENIISFPLSFRLSLVDVTQMGTHSGTVCVFEYFCHSISIRLPQLLLSKIENQSGTHDSMLYVSLCRTY